MKESYEKKKRKKGDFSYLDRKILFKASFSDEAYKSIIPICIFSSILLIRNADLQHCCFKSGKMIFSRANPAAGNFCLYRFLKRWETYLSRWRAPSSWTPASPSTRSGWSTTGTAVFYNDPLSADFYEAIYRTAKENASSGNKLMNNFRILHTYFTVALSDPCI